MIHLVYIFYYILYALVRQRNRRVASASYSSGLPGFFRITSYLLWVCIKFLAADLHASNITLIKSEVRSCM